uniref:Uncharacterized protein n=1 Tax=Anguilla anguilla TaxID=7936 RepID=A0A0E9TWD6_ANGAN
MLVSENPCSTVCSYFQHFVVTLKVN